MKLVALGAILCLILVGCTETENTQEMSDVLVPDVDSNNQSAAAEPMENITSELPSTTYSDLMTLPPHYCLFYNLQSVFTGQLADRNVTVEYTLESDREIEVYAVRNNAEFDSCVYRKSIKSTKKYLWIDHVDDSETFGENGGLLIMTKETGSDTTINISAIEIPDR